MNIHHYSVLLLTLSTVYFSFCMEPRISDLEQRQKTEVWHWLLERISPLNAGRFKTKSKGAKSNCTLIAEKCVKVLAGLEHPSLVPARKKNLDITFRVDEHGTIVYHEVKRLEQAGLVSYQEFTETVDLLDSQTRINIDLTQDTTRDGLKYIASSRPTISDDIKNLPGSAVSQGADKTLAGLIYYYYQDIDAGHLANFFRDALGNVFFVDAQSQEIIDTPPTKVLNYTLKQELFFYPVPPQSGYFIKKESDLDTVTIKQEPQEDICRVNCTCAFSGTPDELKDHIRAMHEVLVNNKRQYQCTAENCTSTHTRVLSLLHHIYSHTGAKPHLCDYPGCNKAFAQLGGLTTHKRTHTGEKPYICTYSDCDKAFSDARALARHTCIHTGEKQYICDYPGCNQAFSQPYNLGVHKRVHTGEKPYICDYSGCNKSFSQLSSLDKHKRIHTGEKQYICDYSGCGKSFSHSSALTDHAYTHTGERPYVCDYPDCDKAYYSSSALSKHKCVHTGKRPYACDYPDCGKAFAQSSTLKRHKRTHTHAHDSNISDISDEEVVAQRELKKSKRDNCIK